MTAQQAPRYASDFHYFANPVRGAKALMSAGRHLGMINTPKQGNKIPPGSWWIADNGRGPGKEGVITGGCGKGWVGGEKFLAWLGKFTAEERDRCVFATAPDVVGDAAATLEMSRPYFGQIRALGFAVAYVLQDGQEDVPVPWDEVDAIFIGGSDDFKLGAYCAQLVAEAKRRGLWVHKGRVNSRKRMLIAHSFGCDSADGTWLLAGARAGIPNLHLPKVMAHLSEINNTQPVRATLALTA